MRRPFKATGQARNILEAVLRLRRPSDARSVRSLPTGLIAGPCERARWIEFACSSVVHGKRPSLVSDAGSTILTHQSGDLIMTRLLKMKTALGAGFVALTLVGGLVASSGAAQA